MKFLSIFADLIDPIVTSESTKCRRLYLDSQAYGWTQLAGGVLDTLADYASNSREPLDIFTEPDFMFNTGYNMYFGVGSAAFFLLPSYLPSCSFSCSSNDFVTLVRDYSFVHGLADQHVHELDLFNFGLEVKVALRCLLKQKMINKQAAMVDDMIEDLLDAGKQIIRLQKRLALVQ